MSTARRGVMRIYGCGGAGINIASFYDKPGESTQPFTSNFDVAMIDTSRSNLNDTIPDEHIAILPNMDGSGKIRAENAAAISDNIRQLIAKYPPRDMSVVVFSASGGSGSVIGPLMTRELLTQGLPVVVIVIGSSESFITTNNTVKTLKTLEAIAEQTGKPVVMFYRHNDGPNRDNIDAELYEIIAILSFFCSGLIKELDSEDILNFLQFDKHTPIRPCLAELHLRLTADAKDWEGLSPIAVASILENTASPAIPIIPEYHCSGYAELNIKTAKDIHLVIDAETARLAAKKTQDVFEELSRRRETRQQPTSLLSDKDKVNDNGLVL